MLFANRSLTEELWRDLFTQHCSQFTSATSSRGEVVNTEEACTALSNWDGRYNLDSHGAILFRELMTSGDLYGFFNGKSFYSVDFDVQQPVVTPSGLTAEGQTYLLTQLANAVLRLQQVGIPMDASLGEHQYALKGSERIPMHGGLGRIDGAFNNVRYGDSATENSTLLPKVPRAEVVNGSSGLTTDGYLINYGASFILTVEFSDDAPIADAILVYSQSDDPDSPHFNDQIELYSSMTWRPLPFTREQIEADPFLTSMRVTE